MRRIGKLLVAVAMTTVLLSVSACNTVDTGQNSENDIPESGIILGSIELRVTDPPPADVASAIVQLEKIEVHMASDNASGSGNASDNSSAGWITILDSPASFDLMDVLGIEKYLGSANVSAGKYTQIRMDVVSVSGTLTDGTPYTAEVPGDKLKIVRSFTVEEGVTTVLTLDFDGEKSLIITGSDKYIFKPVVKLTVKGIQEQEQEQEQEMEQQSGTDNQTAEQEMEMEQENDNGNGNAGGNNK